MAGSVAAWASELVKRRDLLYMVTWREIKVKYKQSVMGFLWAVLMPMVIVGAGLTVKFAFASMAGTEVSHDDLVLVTVKAVPWAFFVSALRFGSNSLIANGNLVTKIYMPREIFPIASVLSQLLDFVVATGVLVVVLAVLRVPLHLSLLWAPLLVALLVLMTAALAILLSAAALFFRDVKYIVEVILTFAIFFTPVFYEARALGRWTNVLMLNPVAPLLEGLGAAVTGRDLPGAGWLVYSALVATAGLALSVAFFKSLEPYFAESV